MKKANKVDKTTEKNHSENGNFNPEPVKILWNKDVKKPSNHSIEDNI